MRNRFDRQLTRLRDEVLTMGSMVEEEMRLALKALKGLDAGLAEQVRLADKDVNATRFALEAECFALIVTQQPAASDLRNIVTVMNMIVDLERMGDQAKGIAKVIPHLRQYIGIPQPSELQQMGDMGLSMLRDGMTAYTKKDVALAQQVIEQDQEVDRLFAHVHNMVMEQMAQTEDPNRVEAIYELLRAARELERFADLATNIADRSIYRVTGNLQEALNNALIRMEEEEAAEGH